MMVFMIVLLSLEDSTVSLADMALPAPAKRYPHAAVIRGDFSMA
jgi:hypothetical protein